MKRVTEKIKDIVEVCPFPHLSDFAADPGLTLASYRFTDITAELMAKWIDRINGVKPGQGAAFALAGFRGVGKSHFLAVLAAIVAHPELRGRISEQHVAASFERLSRRHGPVARVRRGSETSLLDELKRAIAELLEVNAATLSDSLYDLLLTASEKAGELPLVLLIDTALGREARVSRDDGILLSEIAEAAKTLGIFVGVALDDDISGADGANSSISASFTIEYLDQEHLYKIVDAHIFSKHDAMLPLLHEIYVNYRSAMPGFRWSEQRFSSLYPLHPAILEIAPLIRLYVHDFALLRFASEAGVKILGRPANSLIGLDEVFDSVETKLRNVPDLKAAFSAFDKLLTDVVGKLPVQSRLRAKLLLKGLLMLSLNGQGATAAEVAASMMIFDEPDSGTAAIDVENLLESFADTLPTAVKCSKAENSQPKYSFTLTTKEDNVNILNETVAGVPDSVVWDLLLTHVGDKFTDAGAYAGDSEPYLSPCNIEWRGGIRRGLIEWKADDNKPVMEVDESPDWSVVVIPGSGEKDRGDPREAINWKLADPTPEELDTVRRYHLLQHDAFIRSQYGEGIGTAVHVHSIAVEKIWQRLFIEDSLLIAGGTEYRFSEDAAAHSLAQLFTVVLSSFFDARYPQHPEFSQPLGDKESSRIIADFFSGASANSSEVQMLAGTFGFPLGLAVMHGDVYVPAGSADLLALDTVKLIIEKCESDAIIPVDEIADRLMSPPFGLTREAGRLILAALVAQRQFEFVTSSGNRINHRSLDLQIIWDDIVGIAKPLGEVYSPERLLLWAKLITGNSGIASVERSEDRLLIIDSLAGWLAGWKESLILAQFDDMPDEDLNAAVWKTAVSLRKSFGAMAETVEALISDNLSLDKTLHAIAEIFSDSEEEFEKKRSDLRVLKEFISGASKRSSMIAYLALSPVTDNADVEKVRETLLDHLQPENFSVAVSNHSHLQALWEPFAASYADHYIEKHDAVMKGGGVLDAVKAVLRSDEWFVFESLSVIPQFDSRYLAKARQLIRESRQVNCHANVAKALAEKPFCSCSFDPADIERLSGLSGKLLKLVQSGMESFGEFISKNQKALAAAIDEIRPSKENGGAQPAGKEIVEAFDKSGDMGRLTSAQLRLIRLAAMQLIDTGSTVEEIDISDEYLGDFLPGEAAAWDGEVDRLEVFAHIES